MTSSQATTRAGPSTVPAGSASAPGMLASFRAVPSQEATAVNLGPLSDLPGFWQGTGFNLIARPDFSGGTQEGFFLELNLLQRRSTTSAMRAARRSGRRLVASIQRRYALR